MQRRTGLFIGLVLALAACGGPKTVAKDGYRAILAFSEEDRFRVAVRGESVRIEGKADGVDLVKVVRPDLGKSWQLTPATKRVFESPWKPTDEAVPGYPLQPGFDPEGYGDRFGGRLRRLDDATHGLHPCERWEMTLPSGDRAIVWVARDLDRLVVRIQHEKKDSGDEYQPFTDTQLLDVQVGASPKLFEPPEGFGAVKTYEELVRP